MDSVAVTVRLVMGAHSARAQAGAMIQPRVVLDEMPNHGVARMVAGDADGDWGCLCNTG